MKETIYIVATPIGNLSDISLRALEVLKSVDLVLCEDSRRTRILLDHYGIRTRLMSYHKFNEKKFLSELDKIIIKHPKIALVSDSGTPLVSDPGAALIEYSMSNQIPVVPIPGASSLTTLLSVSNIQDKKKGLLFLGFLPHKSGEKEKVLLDALSSGFNFVFFESPNRINQTLVLIGKHDPSSIISLGRELTKLNEQIIEFIAKDAPDILEKGEITALVQSSKTRTKLKEKRELSSLTRKASSSLAEYLGVNRSKAYKILIDLKEKYKD